MDKTLYFISYATAHREQARFLKTAIEELYNETVQCFVASVPDCIPPGGKWYNEILASLRASKGILVLLCPDSINSQWLNFEVGVAIGQKDIDVYPLGFCGLEADEVPTPLNAFQTWDLGDSAGVAAMLEKLHDNLRPKQDIVQEKAASISDYFKALKPQTTRCERPEHLLLPVQDRVARIGSLSTSQHNLFQKLCDLDFRLTERERDKGGVLESKIRSKAHIAENRYFSEKDQSIPVSDSEYYYRLRDLYFMGLIDMVKVGIYKNRWSVRTDILEARPTQYGDTRQVRKRPRRGKSGPTKLAGRV